MAAVAAEVQALPGAAERLRKLARHEARRKASGKAWLALNGSQQYFLKCPIFEALYEGTRGPGKTDSLLMAYARKVEKGYGDRWQGIIFRREYKELDDLVKKSKRWFPAIFGNRCRWLSSKADYKWVWKTGEELSFRTGKSEDDYWSYHGHEIPFLGFEELTNWPSAAFYLTMFSVCRSGDPSVPVMVRATANPWGKGHSWVKARFIDEALPGVPYTDPRTGKVRVRIYGSITENPYLDEEYLHTLASVEDPNKRKAWILGDWAIAAGGILEDAWDESVHAIEPFAIPTSWRVDRAFDWGSSAPYSAGWFAESDGNAPVQMADGTERHFPRGTVFHIAELYGWNGTPNVGCRHTNEEICRRVIEIEAGLIGRLMQPGHTVYDGPADASIFDVINGDSYADEMARNGVIWIPSYKGKGSRVQGWERLRSMLLAAKRNDREKPGFYVFNTCRSWIRTVPVLPRDDKNPDDVDTEAEDHTGDMTRYRLLREPPQEPQIMQIGWTS